MINAHRAYIVMIRLAFSCACGVLAICSRNEGIAMPPKVRELIAEPERAGFVNRGGKGSHRNLVHPEVSKPIAIAGKPSDDAKEYQARAARSAIKESRR